MRAPLQQRFKLLLFPTFLLPSLILLPLLLLLPPSHASAAPDTAPISLVILHHTLLFNTLGGADLSVKWVLSSDVTSLRCMHP